MLSNNQLLAFGDCIVSSFMDYIAARFVACFQLDKELGLERTLNLEGHKAPVICVDWSTSVHYKLCLTASVDGRVRVSTLLTK